MNTNTTLTYIIREADTPVSVSAFLLTQGYSSRLLIHLKNTPRSLLVNDTPVFASCLLHAADRLTVTLTEKKDSSQILPVPMRLTVIYEDEHLIVIDKPAGMPVHPSQGHHENTLANGAAYYLREQGGPFVFRAVNRLDRDTSGLVLLARNMLSSCILSRQVKTHTIRREYLAIVCGRPPIRGTISLPIARKSGSTIERISDIAGGEHAVTHYRTLLYDKDTDLSLLGLFLETGRTHQIRVHMKAIGHPIPGDFLYHPDYRYIGRQALHSARLRFFHPVTGKLLELTAPLPDDMRRLFPRAPQAFSSFADPLDNSSLTYPLKPWPTQGNSRPT